MGSTNKTPNYDLSQFVGTDKPAWLTDYNGDMEKIDMAIYEVDAKADGNSTSVNNLQESVSTLQTGLETANTNIAQNGQQIQSLATSQTQLGVRVGKNETDIATLQGDVSQMQTQQFIWMDASNGVGIKDGTWKTSWFGYAMSALGWEENEEFFPYAEGGIGLTKPGGTTGLTFLQALQQKVAPLIVNKENITKLYLHFTVNDNGSDGPTMVAALSEFVSYVKATFVNCKIVCFALRLWNTVPNGPWWNIVCTGAENLGCEVRMDTKWSPRARSWFQDDMIHYNDGGQHAMGAILQGMFTNSPLCKVLPYINHQISDLTPADTLQWNTTGITSHFNESCNGDAIRVYLYWAFNVMSECSMGWGGKSTMLTIASKWLEYVNNTNCYVDVCVFYRHATDSTWTYVPGMLYLQDNIGVITKVPNGTINFVAGDKIVITTPGEVLLPFSAS